MVEWSITTVLKTVVLRGTGGSNPSLSAKEVKEIPNRVSLFLQTPDTNYIKSLTVSGT